MNIHELITRYEQGEKIKDLATELGKENYKISKLISKYYKEKGIEDPVKKRIRERRERLEQDIEIIYKRLQAGEFQKTIASEYDVSEIMIGQRVLEYCSYNNKPKIEKRIPANQKLTEKDIKAIREEYKTKKTTHQKLADKYNVSASTIQRYLRVLEKTENSSEKDIEEVVVENQEEIITKVIELYESGKSVMEIKDKLELNPKDIRIVLMNYMEIKDRKLSQNSIQILQGLGYDIELIKKVAQAKNIQIEEKQEKER